MTLQQLLLLLVAQIVLTISINSIDNVDTITQRPLLSGDDGVLWRDARELSVGGLASFSDEREMPYDRLPLAAKATVTDGVWKHAVESAGVYAEFVTDASAIYINYTLVNSNLNLWNMDTGL